MKTNMLILMAFLCSSCIAFAQQDSYFKVTFEKNFSNISFTNHSFFIQSNKSILIAGSDKEKGISISKINKAGELVSNNALNVPINFPIDAMHLINESQLLVAGSIKSGIHFSLIDLGEGKIDWSKSIKDTFDFQLHSICSATNENVLFAGTHTNENGNADIIAININGNGGLNWISNFGSPNGEDRINFVNQSTSGDFFIGGAGDDFNAGEFMSSLFKIKNNGGHLWEKKLGLLGQNAAAVGLFEEYEKTLYIAEQVGKRIRISNLNTKREVNWTQFIETKESNHKCSFIHKTTEGDLLLVGSRTDKEGEKLSVIKLEKQRKEVSVSIPFKLKLIDNTNSQYVPVAFKGNQYQTPKSKWKVGQPFQLEAATTEGMYTYVLSVDPKGQGRMHYPRPDEKSIPAKKTMIPATDLSLTLDFPGNEHIVVLHSNFEITNIEELTNAIADLSDKNIDINTVSALNNDFLDSKFINYHLDELALDINPKDKTSWIVPLVLKIKTSTDKVEKEKEPKKDSEPNNDNKQIKKKSN